MEKNFKSPYLIGEVGINHNGSLDLAKKIIFEAKNNNFDAVKLQKRDLNICIPEKQKNIIKNTPWGNLTYFDYKKKIEFHKYHFDSIAAYCRKIDIDLFSSAFDINSLNFLKQYNFKYNKVPSALITNLDFLKEIAKQRKKTFISTGMCLMKNIRKAVKIFKKAKCPFILMHCVSQYPCPDDQLNLNFIKTLKKNFDCEIGYSGHEISVSPSFFAWMLGANYIERHITIDRTMWGTDQAASLEQAGMKNLSDVLKRAKSFFGNGNKKISKQEKKLFKKFVYW